MAHNSASIGSTRLDFDEITFASLFQINIEPNSAAITKTKTSQEKWQRDKTRACFGCIGSLG